MAALRYKYEVLSSDNFYHIYNRANGADKLFRSKENYHYFLQKYQQYISPVGRQARDISAGFFPAFLSFTIPDLHSENKFETSIFRPYGT
jgi:hypothetical protein